MKKRTPKYKTPDEDRGFTTEHSPFWKFLGNLPVTLGVSVAAFGLVTVSLLLLEKFNEVYILGIGLPMVALIFYLSNKFLSPVSSGTLNQRRLFDVLALLFVITWCAWNINFTSQTVYLYRDPGLYNTTARWLIDHDDIDIPAENPFGDSPMLFTTSNAGVNLIKETPGRLYTHGLRLLPTFSAIVGRLFQRSRGFKSQRAAGFACFAVRVWVFQAYNKAKMGTRDYRCFFTEPANALLLPRYVH